MDSARSPSRPSDQIDKQTGPNSPTNLRLLMEDLPSAEELARLLDQRDEELRRLRLALDVLSPIDPQTGMLNRNGIIDAIQDGLNWLIRRNDSFAIMIIDMSGLAEIGDEDERRLLHQHLEAVLAATLRRVDKVGNLGPHSFGAILREFKTEGSPVLIDRLRTIMKAEAERAGIVESEPVFTLALVKPGPFHQAGLLLEQVEAARSEATIARPLIVEL